MSGGGGDARHHWGVDFDVWAGVQFLIEKTITTSTWDVQFEDSKNIQEHPELV